MRTCAAFALLILLAPAAAGAPALPAGVEVQPDVAYGAAGGVTLLLDAYLRAGPGPHPAVVFVHGGGWSAGNRRSDIVLPLLARLAPAGYALFSIEYRLAPQHPYPAAIEDARRAIRFVRANAARFRVDANRVAVAGSSAGGHIVALVGTAPCEGAADAADPVERAACRPRAVLNFYGPTDLRGPFGEAPAVRAFLGASSGPDLERLAAAASPVVHASSDDPPQLVLHGTADRLVPYTQSVEFVQAAARAGMTARLVGIPGGGHGVGGWDGLLPEWSGEMLRWLEQYDR